MYVGDYLHVFVDKIGIHAVHDEGTCMCIEPSRLTHARKMYFAPHPVSCSDTHKHLQLEHGTF